MSSILKALKKLEEEKDLRRDEALDLPREILMARREKQSPSPFKWGAAIIASLLLTIGLTMLIVTRKGDQPASTKAGGTIMTPGPTVVTPVEPGIQEAPFREGVVSIKPAPERPMANGSDAKPRIPYPVDNEPPPAPVTTIRTEPRTVIKALPSLPATASLPPTAQLRKPASPTVPEPAEAGLTVSGIAWNKDSADRYAIINGQPTAIGTYLNGFIVEEILPDRVRFSSEGKIVEILIGKSVKIN
jgi:general secretion pathway protein B